VPLAEEQVTWPVEEWLTQASLLMNDPLQGLLRGDMLHSFSDASTPNSDPASEAQGTLVALGQQLYNALFQGTIRDSWMTAQGIAQHRQEVLRLRLGLKDTRLPRLPWEVLHAGNRSIATGTDVVFSRYHSSFAAMASLVQSSPTNAEANQPLKILLVLAAPTDQEMLALKQEALYLQEELETTLQNGSRNGSSRYSEIQLTILEQPGREQLTQALEHNHYHVLHYAGHSNSGAAGGKLYLVSSKTGLTETLSGDDLAGLLVNNGIRMAVFNSCRGVYTATTEAATETGEGNLAEALVKRGIPAVLAMAERIPDDVALNLSRLFYRNLKQVYPVDLSLNRARQGLVSSYSSKQLYWALPILYLHPEFDGNLQSLDGLSGQMNDVDRLLESDPPVKTIEPIAPFAALESVLPSVSALRDGTEALLNPLKQAESDRDELVDVSTSTEDESSDLEALEFDDPAYESDMESVAHLVNQLSYGAASEPSEDDRLLPAPPSENLLPEAGYTFKADDYLVLPDYPHELAPLEPAASELDSTQPGGALTSTAVDASEVEVYSELTRMLAETGKLTEAIATCHQAIQDNPNDANAYYRLGMALNQQGYVSEAIAAYHQALRLNPTLADAHNQLGLALYQQGNLTDAVQSYDHAIQLDPELTSAKRNLEATLLRQGNLGEAKQALLERAPAQRRSTEQPLLAYADRNLQLADGGSASIAYRKAPWYRQPLLWVGAGMVATLVAGSWFFRDRWLPTTPQLPPAETAFSANSTGELKQLSTNLVAALATERLNQGKLTEAQAAIETLFDRGALVQAAAVLTSALGREPENPTVNFLMGRLAWQSVKVGNNDYSVDDARRYWETAAKRQPSAQYQNALGFAYYTEGKVDRASRAWLQATKLEGGQSTKAATQTSTSPSPILTAYAGLALIAAKTAANQPPTKQASLKNEAIQLRQRVLADDPVNFQPEELAKNWMWSETAIRDWRSTLAIK
jgi:tetratricopeptide (TPR) repeat protein